MEQLIKRDCFVISPIGEAGSEIRQEADDVLELIIVPALELYDFTVVRGDHHSDANQIDIDVIKSVQDSFLCICDISRQNVNVYYEMGRRDETGKPIILLKAKNSDHLPVDIATRRYIEYDLDDRYGQRDAIEQIRKAVIPILESNGSNTRATSLGEIGSALERVERKLDRLSNGSNSLLSNVATNTISNDQFSDLSARERFKLALGQKNVLLAESVLGQIQGTVDPITFYDYYVEQAASMGSDKAGQMLIENAENFLDQNVSLKKKIDYLGSLVSYAGRKDREGEVQQLVELMADRILSECTDAEPSLAAAPHNQKNRLYYGLYVNTKDKSYLEMAISELEKAYQLIQENYICYNLAMCLYELGKYEEARFYIDECLRLSGDKQDADHLRYAIRIYNRLKDPRLADTMELLQKISPGKAELLRAELAKLNK